MEPPSEKGSGPARSSVTAKACSTILLTMEVSPRPCAYRLGRSRKAFDPFLVIAVERTGMPAPDLLKEEGALLRLLR